MDRSIDVEATLLFEPNHVFLLNYYNMSEEEELSVVDWYHLLVKCLIDKNVAYQKILINGEILKVGDGEFDYVTVKDFTSICEVVLNNDFVESSEKSKVFGEMSLDLALIAQIKEMAKDVRISYSAEYSS